MIHNTTIFAARMFAAAMGLAVVFGAAAQSPAVSPKEADQAKQQAAQQIAQPLNNQPVWNEVRTGMPQYTSIPGRETNVLVQSSGQTWRALRDGQISIYGGWALVVVFLSILTFYWRRGAIELHAPATGRKIQRFTSWERSVHWATAISFSILALSGLVILFGKSVLLPLIGYTLFSWLAILAKNLHNFVGPLFCVCIVLLFFTFVRNNFWKSYDLTWLKQFGGLFSGREVPSGKFNAGEKVWFWGGALVLGVIVSASGLVLDFPNFNQTRQTMQIANVVHSVATIMFMLAGFGHIYMGTIGMAGALDAMRTGYVDETWAREHHEYWYNEVRIGTANAGAAMAKTVPRTA
jgi:formate dehydrogenase subunit gamma